LIFLIDQSASMSEPFGGAQAGAGKRKCDMVATILNGLLNELIVTNTVIAPAPDFTPEVRPRADISVLGYEGDTVKSALAGELAKLTFATLAELQMHPLAIEKRKKKEIDDIGREIEEVIPFPVWLKPKASGNTPMCAALETACQLAANWAEGHPDNYPPVIVNITDGVATDGDISAAAHRLTQVQTNDGAALLFNVHITTLNNTPVAYPASENELPNDQFARLLFSLSSVIPESGYAFLQPLLGRNLHQGARGFIFNGDAISLRQMFVFATAPATQQAFDWNR
jgi:hypothetical protein